MHDNGTAVLESLWAGGSAAATDMPAIAFQLRTQGFNGIRLPFTFDDLRAPPKSMWAKQGCQKVRGWGGALAWRPAGAHDAALGGVALACEQLALKVTASARWTNPAQVTLGAAAPGADPAATGAAGDAPTRCSFYLPDTSSLDRYLWALQWFVGNGYYVLMEHSPLPGDSASSNKEAFADSWRWLWRAAACLPNWKSDLEGRVFAGLMAEPDMAGHRWETATGQDGVELPGEQRWWTT